MTSLQVTVLFVNPRKTLLTSASASVFPRVDKMHCHPQRGHYLLVSMLDLLHYTYVDNPFVQPLEMTLCLTKAGLNILS